MGAIRSHIIGTGSYVPEFVLTNDLLEQMVDTSDEWIVKRTGIRERRIAKGMATWEMGLAAARRALADAGRTAADLDMILVSTVTPDSYAPSVACVLQSELGARQAAAMDLNAACTGFIYTVDTADSFIRAGKAKTILVVAAEGLSRLIDYTDRSTCVLFGDGAAAAVLEAGEGEGIITSYLAADGTLGHCLYAGALPVEENPLQGDRAYPQDHRFLKMEGNEVFRFTANAVPEAIDQVLERGGVTAAEVDWFILHQANARIINMVVRRYGLDSEKVYMNMEHYGNTSSASVPICIDEMRRKGLLRQGQLAVLCGFGAGLTYGAILMRF